MLSIQPVITAVVVVLTPISLFVASFIAKKTFVMFRKQSETRGELTSLTDEMLGNMKAVSYTHLPPALWRIWCSAC